MSVRYATKGLGQLLIDEGVFPEGCLVRDVELKVPVDGLVLLNCEILMSTEKLQGFHRALGTLIAQMTVKP